MRRASCLLILCLLGTTVAAPQATLGGPERLSQKEADQGFISIFDGKTLTGWKGSKRGKGPLGFLGHGTRVEFRNLRVKKL